MKAMMGENRIFVDHMVHVYGGLKKFMAIIGGLRYLVAELYCNSACHDSKICMRVVGQSYGD